MCVRTCVNSVYFGVYAWVCVMPCWHTWRQRLVRCIIGCQLLKPKRTNDADRCINSNARNAYKIPTLFTLLRTFPTSSFSSFSSPFRALFLVYPSPCSCLSLSIKCFSFLFSLSPSFFCIFLFVSALSSSVSYSVVRTSSSCHIVYAFLPVLPLSSVSSSTSASSYASGASPYPPRFLFIIPFSSLPPLCY